MCDECLALVHAIWAAATVAIVLTIGGYLYNGYAWHEIVKGGYTQTTLAGSSGSQWVKQP